MTTSYSIPSGDYAQNILLDSSIRDWVVLPLLILMIEAGLLRHYLSQVLNSTKGRNIPKIEHRVKNSCFRASKLRSGAASYLSRSKWEARRTYWTDADDGYLTEELQWIEEQEEREAEGGNDDGQEGKNESSSSGKNNNAAKKSIDDDMPDPMAMMGPLKGQAVFMIQNMVMMQGIGYFFQGFVLLKVPFPLTMGFKMMFHRGLDLSTLETSYVSSVSWYFLVMFGLRAFLSLVIQGSKIGMPQEEMESMIAQSDLGVSMSGGGNPMANKFDGAAMIKREQETLDMTRFKGKLDDAERRLLKKKKRSNKLSGAVKNGEGEPGYDIFGAGTGASKVPKKFVKKGSKVKAN